MADGDRVRQVARILSRKKLSGHRVAVVVSARDRQTYLLKSLTLLRESAIRITGLQTSSFRISFLIECSRMNEVVQLFHRHFVEPTYSGSAGA